MKTLKDFINESEVIGLKGVCRLEDAENNFNKAEIWTAIMNGEIYEPRPGFLKVSK